MNKQFWLKCIESILYNSCITFTLFKNFSTNILDYPELLIVPINILHFGYEFRKLNSRSRQTSWESLINYCRYKSMGCNCEEGRLYPHTKKKTTRIPFIESLLRSYKFTKLPQLILNTHSLRVPRLDIYRCDPPDENPWTNKIKLSFLQFR